jgi:hypothetical protein
VKRWFCGVSEVVVHARQHPEFPPIIVGNRAFLRSHPFADEMPIERVVRVDIAFDRSIAVTIPRFILLSESTGTFLFRSRLRTLFAFRSSHLRNASSSETVGFRHSGILQHPRESRRNIIQGQSSGEARRTVLDMFPDSVVTGVSRIK